MTRLIRGSFHHTTTTTREEGEGGGEEEEEDTHMGTCYEFSPRGPRSGVNPTA